MKNTLPLAVAAVLLSVTCLRAGVPSDYKGKPFEDEKYKDGPQSIPGTVECAYYDLGGQDVAYHANDPNDATIPSKKNYGGNDLNLKEEHHRPQSNEYYWTFRKDDLMSTSYTKDFVDFTTKNLYQPKFNQLYIGWTANGNWANYTVNVKKAGKYKIVAVYSNRPNYIRFSINNKPAAVCKLPLDTGYYHHWNRAEIGEITFDEAGLQLLTFHFDAPAMPDKRGGNNFAYFEFFPEDDARMANDDQLAAKTAEESAAEPVPTPTPEKAADKTDDKAK
ncbi:MAG TPA: hypothetical protein VG733_03540 [Chthoniobacteraceae bacterium]|nr:hypothetical protein [Chthoniobacteraceae bacterium]